MLPISKIVPSDVQTGLTKGRRDTAQELKGRRLKVVSADFDFARPEPALAEYASSEAHSLCVICGYVSDYISWAMQAEGGIHRACPYLMKKGTLAIEVTVSEHMAYLSPCSDSYPYFYRA